MVQLLLVDENHWHCYHAQLCDPLIHFADNQRQAVSLTPTAADAY